MCVLSTCINFLLFFTQLAFAPIDVLSLPFLQRSVRCAILPDLIKIRMNFRWVLFTLMYDK